MVATRGDGKGAVIVEEQRQRKEIKPAWREAPWRLVLLNIDNVSSSVYVAVTSMGKHYLYLTRPT